MATYAPKIKKEDALIDWTQPAEVIDQKIRAFHPWPVAYTHLDENVLRIHQAHVEACPSSGEKPGAVLSMDKHGLLVATGHQALRIERLQFSGAKTMSVSDWLNGGRTQLHTNVILR